MTATHCMALNIYYEAAYEPLNSQMAVAFVTMNRAHHKIKNVCNVVYKPRQFSWTNKPEVLKPHGKEWKQAKTLAKLVLYGKPVDFTNGAKYFYGYYIKPPKWSKNMVVVGRYGKHIFLKENYG